MVEIEEASGLIYPILRIVIHHGYDCRAETLHLTRGCPDACKLCRIRFANCLHRRHKHRLRFVQRARCKLVKGNVVTLHFELQVKWAVHLATIDLHRNRDTNTAESLAE